MKKIIWLVVLNLIISQSIGFAAPPTRTYTYTSGQVIDPAKVTTNEDSLFNYLTTGVDTFADNAVTTSKILDGTIVNVDISGTAAITYGKLSLGSSLLTGDIKDGEIVNADISSSAAIVDTKLATISTAGKVDGAALTGLANIPAGAGIIPAANLTAAGDMYYANTRFKVGSFTRVLSVASGTAAVTGVGFQPKSVIFIAYLTSYSGAVGASDGTTNEAGSIVGTTPAYNYNTGRCVDVSDGTKGGYASIASFDADGFTLTWVKDGSPTETATISYMAFR